MTPNSHSAGMYHGSSIFKSCHRQPCNKIIYDLDGHSLPSHVLCGDEPSAAGKVPEPNEAMSA